MAIWDLTLEIQAFYKTYITIISSLLTFLNILNINIIIV
jgi:hypothetical protein